MRKSFSRPPVGGFTLNQDSPLAKGLVVWLPLIDRNLKDRVNGLSFALSGTTPTPDIAGELGNCWKFTTASSTDMVTTTTPVTAPPCTIACWFYPTQVASTKDLVTIANSGNTTDFIQLEHAGGAGVRARQGDTTSTSNATSTNTVVANVWQLAVGVFLSTASRSAFLNGTGKATSTATRTPAGLNVVGVGAQMSSVPTSFYGGYLNNVMVWNRALSDAEVWRLWDPLTRWELYNPAVWTGQGVTAPAAASSMSRGNVRPVSRAGIPIQYLRI